MIKPSALAVFCPPLRPIVRFWDPYFNVNEGLVKASSSEVFPLHLSCQQQFVNFTNSENWNPPPNLRQQASENWKTAITNFKKCQQILNFPPVSLVIRKDQKDVGPMLEIFTPLTSGLWLRVGQRRKNAKFPMFSHLPTSCQQVSINWRTPPHIHKKSRENRKPPPTSSAGVINGPPQIK